MERAQAGEVKPARSAGSDRQTRARWNLRSAQVEAGDGAPAPPASLPHRTNPSDARTRAGGTCAPRRLQPATERRLHPFSDAPGPAAVRAGSTNEAVATQRSRSKDPGPWIIFGAQSLCGGIAQDVAKGLCAFCTMSQAVIEIIELPADIAETRRDAFPVGDNATHREMPRKREYSVEVIRHQKNEGRMPASVFVVVSHCVEQGCGGGRRN